MEHTDVNRILSVLERMASQQKEIADNTARIARAIEEIALKKAGPKAGSREELS